MEASYRFFENRACRYFPCHKGQEPFNCLFCYCPMYFLDRCLGQPEIITVKGKAIKSCMNCTYPHDPGHYDAIMKYLSERL